MKGFLIGLLAGVLLAGVPFLYLLRESKEETQTARNSIVFWKNQSDGCAAVSNDSPP
jgi:hypothetical protein